MELVVYLKDESDLEAIESLLKRLKLHFEKRKSPTETPNTDIEREKNLLELRYLAAQIKQSTFGDPLQWQEETRKDNTLPFRGNQ